MQIRWVTRLGTQQPARASPSSADAVGAPASPLLSGCDFRGVEERFWTPAEARLAKGRMEARRREEGTVARQEYGHLVLAMAALVGCALLLVSFQFAHGRAALLSGLLPIMQHAFSGPVPPRPGPSNAHRLFGALDRPLEQSGRQLMLPALTTPLPTCLLPIIHFASFWRSMNTATKGGRELRGTFENVGRPGAICRPDSGAK